MNRFDALPDGHGIAGRFILRGVIGRGRSSIVYKAFDPQTNSTVALKVLDPFLAHDETSVTRFSREVGIIRSLQHPNIVKVYEFLRDGELYVICMEYVDAIDGKSYVARYGQMPVREFLSIAKNITAAVDACHRQKVLHRDLKPQNILMSSNGTVKVVDFGVSKINTMSDLTKTGTILGTPEYMAPELFQSTQADPRCDIYALGAVFYEFLTGAPPFTAGSLPAIMSRQLRGEIDRIALVRQDVPSWLEAIVFKCLKTDPSARFQSCYELQADIERGERALAAFEERNETACCLSCKTELISNLPFCHGCGRLGAEMYEKGRHALVLYRCDDVNGVSRYLRRTFPTLSVKALQRSLSMKVRHSRS